MFILYFVVVIFSLREIVTLCVFSIVKTFISCILYTERVLEFPFIQRFLQPVRTSFVFNKQNL